MINLLRIGLSSYIEATGHQRVYFRNNGITAPRIEIRFEIRSLPSSGNNYIFNSYTLNQGSGAYPAISLFYSNTNLIFWLGTGEIVYMNVDLAPHVLYYDGVRVFLDGVEAGEAEFSSDLDYLYLFYNGSSSSTYAQARIYYVKIWDGDNLTRDLVPIFASEKYRFHDNIENQNYGNDTTYALLGYISQAGEVVLTDGEIQSIKTVEAVSLLGDELSYDTMAADVQQKRTLSLEPVVDDPIDEDEVSVVVSYGNDLQPMPYGTQILHYLDDELAARYYIEEMKRIGMISFGIDAISAIGLLSRQYHKGGLFSGENFILVASEILGDSIEYSVSPELADVRVYGHLPYATRRDNLRQLLFATNGHVFRDDNKRIYFDFLDDSETVEVLDDDIFENGSVEYPKLATKVTLTEHNYYYYSGVDTVTLFDNTNGAEVSNLLVKFQNAPIYPASLTASSGLTFTNASVNCATVSGRGTLTGKPYVHTVLDITRYDSDSGREEYEISVTDATLVTAVNSESVADRIADYWFHRHIVKADIKWSGEKCGKRYAMQNVFLENEEGFLVRMEKVVSSFVRASCEFVAGVGSGGGGNTFENYALITASGSWSIPAGVDTIRLILVGGGHGGQSGLKGQSGSNSNGGAGGAAGSPGEGGRIYILTLTDVSGSLAVSIGTGGAGGSACSNEKIPNEGTDGNPTTVTYNGKIYTSSAGSRSPSGVENIFTQIIYALPGSSGIAGGNGGNGQEGQSEAGWPSGAKTGGTPGNSVMGLRSQTSGGAGGGASATTDGSAGGNASAVHVQRQTSSEIFDYYSHTPGAGGNGASATQRAAATVPGAGGDGGHGGGAGGGIGVFNGTIWDYTDSAPGASVHYKIGDERSSTTVNPGTGGNGGAGGNGASGCVIIYY